MPILAELEFKIGPRSADKSSYPIAAELSINGQKQVFPDDVAKLDPDALFNLRAEHDKYNTLLSTTFFQAENVKDALIKARAHLDQAGSGNMLRIRLLIESEAQELHHVRWECLRDHTGKPLFNGDTILFSRYLSSSNLRPVNARTEPKALIAIANPSHLDQAINPEDPEKGLAAVDVKSEKQRAETGLTGAGFAVTTLASPPFGNVPATLDNIGDELEKGYDILYLVCHGGLVPSDAGTKPMLWLEDGEDPIDAGKLVERIRNMANQPRLVILASCQSAGADGTALAASGTLGALGPLLADAGVPAVIAMQGNIRMDTVDKFMPQFFSELAKDGQIDRAMGKARGYAHEMDCMDYWMPTLFMRLSDGLIWSDPDRDIKAKARAIFTDLSTRSAILPNAQVTAMPEAQPGEVRPDDPAVWKSVISAPNMLPYAILREFGSGRVIALGHEHMLSYQNADGQNYFLQEAMSWLKGSREAAVVLSAKPSDTVSLYMSPTFSIPVLRNKFASWGYRTDGLQDLSNQAALSKAGILVIANAWGAFTPQEIDAITKFVNDGGGLLGAGLGWSWLQYAPRNKRATPKIEDYPMNQLFKVFGASWSEYLT